MDTGKDTEIVRLSLFDYFLLPREQWRCGLSDHFARQIVYSNGSAYALLKGGTMRAYALVACDPSGTELKYLFTDAEERKKGFAEELLRRILSLQEEQKAFRIPLVSNQPFFDTIVRIAGRLGFSEIRAGSIYRTDYDEKDPDDGLTRLRRVRRFLCRDGSECVSFAEMDADIRQQLLDSRESEYGNILRPSGFLENAEMGLCPELSFALVNNGRLRAYTLITSFSEDSVCFEQISESRMEIGSGIIVAPFCASMEEICRTGKIRRIRYFIHDANQRSSGFIEEFLKGKEIKKLRSVILVKSGSEKVHNGIDPII